MKAALISVLVGGAAGAKTEADPIGQVLSLLDDLAAKVAKDGETQQAAYEDYFSWCDDTSKEKANEITSATDQKAKLEATIDALISQVSVCDQKIADLVKSIAANGKDLAAATKIRADESAVFDTDDAELEDVVATLGKAISKLGGASGSASFAQIANSPALASSLKGINAILDAASISSSDKQKLTALVQSHEESEDDDSELGAPQAANYESKSGSIVDILADMKGKAEVQLSELRKAENTAKQNFEKLKQSLENQIGNDESDMTSQKQKKSGAEEGKATAEGELEVTSEDLKTSTNGLALTQKDCMQVAIDHEAAMKANADEIKVIGEAKKIISEATSFVQTSFLQTTMETAMQSVQTKIAKVVRRIARDQHSTNLAQLASRIIAMSRSGAFGTSDPFVKIRGMITEMITKLEDQMGAEAQEKAYCDEEMSKTEAKKSDLEAVSAKLTNKIDKSSARSAELKEQVTVLQEELAALAKESETMDKVRAEDHATYVQVKADLDKGLAGIRKALSLLKDYYGAASSAALVQEDNSQPAPPAGHSADGGAGGSIISILEVAEEDMAKELAKVEMLESDEQSAYDETVEENKLTKASKDQDVKYKQQEAAGLDKSITELSNDRDATNTELGAVNSYYTKLQGRCVAKPVPYETRKKAREAEINGLKEALNVLEEEAALVQRGSKNGRRSMRGSAMQL
jgi:hypothetical protein